MKPLLFTLIGADKTGLVESLAQQVKQLGGNWLGSNFAHMSGHFAGFVEVDLPEDKHQALIDAFKQHPDLQIQLVSAESRPVQQNNLVELQVTGNDRSGIVQDVAAVLRQFNINIMEFSSSCASAPNWGNKLFTAKATLAVPEGFDTDELIAALEHIANDLMVDLDPSN